MTTLGNCYGAWLRWSTLSSVAKDLDQFSIDAVLVAVLRKVRIGPFTQAEQTKVEILVVPIGKAKLQLA